MEISLFVNFRLCAPQFISFSAQVLCAVASLRAHLIASYLGGVCRLLAASMATRDCHEMKVKLAQFTQSGAWISLFEAPKRFHSFSSSEHMRHNRRFRFGSSARPILLLLEQCSFRTRRS